MAWYRGCCGCTPCLCCDNCSGAAPQWITVEIAGLVDGTCDCSVVNGVDITLFPDAPNPSGVCEFFAFYGDIVTCSEQPESPLVQLVLEADGIYATLLIGDAFVLFKQARTAPYDCTDLSGEWTIIDSLNEGGCDVSAATFAIVATGPPGSTDCCE